MTSLTDWSDKHILWYLFQYKYWNDVRVSGVVGDAANEGFKGF